MPQGSIGYASDLSRQPSCHRLYPSPRHRRQIHGQLPAHDRRMIQHRHHRQATPWSSTFPHKAAIFLRPGGFAHTSGIQQKTYLPPGRQRRKYICPSCRGIQSWMPAGIAAHRTDMRKNNIRNRYTGLWNAAQPRLRYHRSSPPDKLLCTVHPSNACTLRISTVHPVCHR